MLNNRSITITQKGKYIVITLSERVNDLWFNRKQILISEDNDVKVYKAKNRESGG